MQIVTKEKYTHLGIELEVLLPSYSESRASKRCFLELGQKILSDKDDNDEIVELSEEDIENLAKAINTYIPALDLAEVKNLLIIGSDVDNYNLLGYLFSFGIVSTEDKKK